MYLAKASRPSRGTAIILARFFQLYARDATFSASDRAYRLPSPFRPIPRAEGSVPGIAVRDAGSVKHRLVISLAPHSSGRSPRAAQQTARQRALPVVRGRLRDGRLLAVVATPVVDQPEPNSAIQHLQRRQLVSEDRYETGCPGPLRRPVPGLPDDRHEPERPRGDRRVAGRVRRLSGPDLVVRLVDLFPRPGTGLVAPGRRLERHHPVLQHGQRPVADGDRGRCDPPPLACDLHGGDAVPAEADPGHPPIRPLVPLPGSRPLVDRLERLCGDVARPEEGNPARLRRHVEKPELPGELRLHAALACTCRKASIAMRTGRRTR